MKSITSLEVLPSFNLQILFDNGVTKIIDMKPYLVLPVFQVLNNPDNFNKVTCKDYFIEWEEFELDLSADTLWHDGKELIDHL